MCADCTAPNPEWASVNTGTLICIDCAGVHRSMGAHISKVKSLTLDRWRPEEVQSLCAAGGNDKANQELAQKAGLLAPRPPPDANREAIDAYILRKYGCLQSGPLLHASQNLRPQQPPVMRNTGKPVGQPSVKALHSAPIQAVNGKAQPRAPSLSTNPGPTRATQLPPSGPRQRRAQQLQGPVKAPTFGAKHQGLVIMELFDVQIFEERVRELKVFGPMFLSLSVHLSLGLQEAEPTPSRFGSANLEWDPPERRELVWDCEERHVWCTVYDDDYAGNLELAGEGCVNIREAIGLPDKTAMTDVLCSGGMVGSSGGGSAVVQVDLYKRVDPAGPTLCNAKGFKEIEFVVNAARRPFSGYDDDEDDDLILVTDSPIASPRTDSAGARRSTSSKGRVIGRATIKLTAIDMSDAARLGGAPKRLPPRAGVSPADALPATMLAPL